MNNFSVVIPAYNEAAVIVRCLKSVREANCGELPQVIVVANNCSDDTAQRARDYDPSVVVIETPIGSKTHAMNLADEVATCFPRFYMDADITLEKNGLPKLCKELDKPGIFFVLPQASIKLEDRAWAVRAYYKVWAKLTAHRSGMVGSGVYGLGQEGRKRFDQFPRITADDNFARLHFTAAERATVRDCKSFVTPPKTLANIIDIKTRSHFGNEELKKLYPELWTENESGSKLRFAKLALNPLWLPSLAVFLYVKFAVKKRVRERFKQGEIHKWERDDTSREEVSC
ncbi:glycosyltransferase [Bremerella cremea]|uniref:Glycosyltransferase n=1 Tax=Bremerella cremea TaxID=1031537 RepID=A0A368KP98_9BACT|nr:glycosyltransferase family 2 protein [Bremerella cremea]RCS46355.1 glycosyltransferase [Bremerella cremea]